MLSPSKYGTKWTIAISILVLACAVLSGKPTQDRSKADAPLKASKQLSKARAALDLALFDQLASNVGLEVSVEGVSWGVERPEKGSDFASCVIYRQGEVAVCFNESSVSKLWKSGVLVRVTGTIKMNEPPEDATSKAEGRQGLGSDRWSPPLYALEVKKLEFIDKVANPTITVLDQQQQD